MSASTIYIIILGISTFLFSLIGTYSIRTAIRSLGQNTMQEPSERDNHEIPTPKGGGIAVMVALIGFLLVGGINGYVLLALMMLTILSAINDTRDLTPQTRLIFHLIAAIVLVSSINWTNITNVIPAVALFPLLVLALVWFMNLYNFMDGIDEITSMQTVMIGGGVLVLCVMDEALPTAFMYDSVMVICAIAGFWVFNRHPATIFLGDSGSIPLGAFIGWLLLSLAAAGYVWIAAMLPAYYVVDASLTLVKRVARGYKPWQAHSEHAYQRVVRAGKPHSTAVLWIGTLNTAIILASIAAWSLPALAPFICAGVYAAACLMHVICAGMKPRSSIIDITPRHQPHAAT